MSLERDAVESTLFDWRTWRLAACAGQLGLQLISEAVRQAATKWIGSHLWLLERSLHWINEVLYNENGRLDAHHLAAQLIVALKPYTGKNINRS